MEVGLILEIGAYAQRHAVLEERRFDKEIVQILCRNIMENSVMAIIQKAKIVPMKSHVVSL